MCNVRLVLNINSLFYKAAEYLVRFGVIHEWVVSALKRVFFVGLRFSSRITEFMSVLSDLNHGIYKRTMVLSDLNGRK